MKLLKAFVRTSKVDDVIRSLEGARAPGITVSRVHGLGYGYEPLAFTLAPSEIRKAPEVAKVEVVCRDEDLDRLLAVLAAAARTGEPGDGIVFVTPVERALKIRTGERGSRHCRLPSSPKDPSHGQPPRRRATRMMLRRFKQIKENTMINHRFPRFARGFAAACAATFFLAAAATGAGPAAAGKTSRDAGLSLKEVRARAEKYIDDESAIRLTAAQAQVRAEALEPIPAPCCREYSMRTCCCPCNLARSVWGLSNFLIAKKGYTAAQVKGEVLRWLAAINPAGFTGKACFDGGCKRPFSKNGCGGMEASEVIVGDEVR
ncbi:MAG: P-II family nitrogen regulator [Acidobacteriota bacterium]